MKKFMVLIISLMSFFILSSCTTTNNSSLQGFYQSERTTDGYVIQISIQSDENSFVQYIDNLIKADYDSVLKGCQCFEKGLILDGRIKKFQNR